jgi:hypothetical protein
MLVTVALIESFDDVRGLDEPALRALLDEGRPEERVWAIWALALRSADNVGQLGARREPDAGVRRNLAVVLAGHGHLDLLVALAIADPAPEVRAAAMTLVARLAVDGKLPRALVADRVRSDGSEVRLAVLRTITSGSAAPFLLELAEDLTADPDLDVRCEAFEALARGNRADRALAWLEQVPEAEARLVLMRWAADTDRAAYARALAGASRRLRRFAIESVRGATWRDLAPVIGDDPTLLGALVKRDRGAIDDMPLAALVRAALRDRRGAWTGSIRDRLAELEHAPAEVAALLPELCELCTRRIAEIDRYARELAREGGELHQLLADERAIHERALDQAMRLMVH